VNNDRKVHVLSKEYTVIDYTLADIRTHWSRPISTD